MPWERLHDLSHHPEQLAVTVYLPRTVTLRASALPKHSTDPSFRDLLMPQGPPDRFRRPATTLGAHQFGRAASLRISMSNAWSATSFFSRETSPRSALHCVASSSENPFQPRQGHKDSLTRPGSRFGEGLTSWLRRPLEPDGIDHGVGDLLPLPGVGDVHLPVGGLDDRRIGKLSRLRFERHHGRPCLAVGAQGDVQG